MKRNGKDGSQSIIGLLYPPSASLVALYPMLQLSHIFLRWMLLLLPLSVYFLWHTGQLTVVDPGIRWLST